MKNIAKFTITAAIATMSLAAEAKSIQEIIAEDAAKDPYALQDQAYQSNEHGEAAEAPEGNAFELKEVTTETYEEPATKKASPDSEEGLSLQKYNAKEKRGVKRVPINRKQNVIIPEYSR